LKFVDTVEFGASANGESFGRYANGVGPLVPMQTLTLGGENSEPRVGPLVISEIQYSPADPGNLPAGVSVSDLEFIEIYNPTDADVDLTGWRLRRGADFDFALAVTPPGQPVTTLAAHTALVVVAFDPNDIVNADKLVAFRSAYNLDETTVLVGGYTSDLDDEGDAIQLQRPDEPPLEEPLFVPHLYEDEVEYDDISPWPDDVNGTGKSIHRVDLQGFGNDSASWHSAAPTPGVVFTTLAKVTGVAVSGSTWNASFVTAVDGFDGIDDGGYTLPTGSIAQLATLPWSNLDQVSITFDEDVNVTQDDLGVVGVNEIEYTSNITGFAYNDTTFTATWSFSAAFSVDKLLLVLSDEVTAVGAGVGAGGGGPLDGEWSNGVSTQSGNDIAGGDFHFRLNVLPGDANQTQIVAGDDALAVIDRIISFPGFGAYRIFNDINGDALIAGNDALLVIDQIISFLPGGEPSLPARIGRFQQQQGISRSIVGSSPSTSALPTEGDIDTYTTLIQTLGSSSGSIGSTSSTNVPDSPDMASYWDSILEMEPVEIGGNR